MNLTDTEYENMLNDPSKIIEGDIFWSDNEDHAPSFEFRMNITSDTGWPLVVQGSYNPLIPALTYVIILKTVGRIYGLDMGKDHHNPQCTQAGEKHKHRWSNQYRDKEAYSPNDITAPVTDPVTVWKQFCTEANLLHNGIMNNPPPFEGDLFL